MILSAMDALDPNLSTVSIVYTMHIKMTSVIVNVMIGGSNLIVAYSRASVTTSAMDVMVLAHATVRNVLKMPPLITTDTVFVIETGAATSA